VDGAENALSVQVKEKNVQTKGTQPFNVIYGARLYVNAQGCKNRFSRAMNIDLMATCELQERKKNFS